MGVYWVIIKTTILWTLYVSDTIYAFVHLLGMILFMAIPFEVWI